jgi:hypothetical protein
MILDVLRWIEGTRWSVALHESLYVWPLLESTHVLTLALFVGTAVMLDLRLLGVALPGVPASALTSRLLPWTRGGFAVMVLTGVLLFLATPVTYYHSIFFRVKALLLIAAGLNVWLFHGRVHREVDKWDRAVAAPRAARIAAIVSLVCWTGVVVAGRLIAYNWFACDLQPQPAFVNWAAQCPIGAAPGVRDAESLVKSVSAVRAPGTVVVQPSQTR